MNRAWCTARDVENPDVPIFRHAGGDGHGNAPVVGRQREFCTSRVAERAELAACAVHPGETRRRSSCVATGEQQHTSIGNGKARVAAAFAAMRSATGNASPVILSVAASKGTAINVPSRLKRICPDATTADDSACRSVVASGGVERAYPDPRGLGCRTARADDAGVNEMTAVGEKRRESVPRFAVLLIKHGQQAEPRHPRPRRAAGRRPGRKDDDVVAIPRAATPRPASQSATGGPPDDEHFLQLPVGEESDVTAVGRPERKGPSSVPGIGCARRERPQPQLKSVLRARHEHNVAPSGDTAAWVAIPVPPPGGALNVTLSGGGIVN